jgi:hypothetical protein
MANSHSISFTRNDSTEVGPGAARAGAGTSRQNQRADGERRKGMYFDYDFVHKRVREYQAERVVRNLSLFECSGGLAERHASQRRPMGRPVRLCAAAMDCGSGAAALWVSGGSRSDFGTVPDAGAGWATASSSVISTMRRALAGPMPSSRHCSTNCRQPPNARWRRGRGGREQGPLPNGHGSDAKGSFATETSRVTGQLLSARTLVGKIAAARVDPQVG